MGVVITPASALGIELAKWEQHRTGVVGGIDGDGDPGNPYVYRPFPKMLYRAQRHPKLGKVMCVQAPPQEYEFATMNDYMRACNEVEQFNRSCYKIVNSEDEMRVAKNDGWCEGPDNAVAAAHERDKSFGNAAAERHYADKNLGEKARAEAELVDRELEGHQPVITPEHVKAAKEEVKKRG